MNLAQTVAPKSDQLNSDDLIAGPLTLTITRVNANEANPDQPVNIWFEGDNGKPFRPCKSMRRVLISVWGSDGLAYVGRSLTLYRDPEVAFGGMKVGGIRISHMSDIDRPMTMALTATKAQRKPYTVQPLAKPAALDVAAVQAAARAAARQGRDAFAAHWKGVNAAARDAMAPIMGELRDLTMAAADPFGLPALSDADADRLAAEARAETDRMAEAGE